jgi:pimeloyl-ACP methyl ester carboxylesterase
VPVRSAELAKLALDRSIQGEMSINGSRTLYWKYPAKGESKGTIVFVHGFRGAHDGLHTIIGALDDFDCFAGDIPGYGQSDRAKTKHDLETYSNWLGGFIEALNLAKPTVVGHSFGSLIVSAHAAAQRGDMGKVVLINPVSKPGLEGPRRLISKLVEVFIAIAMKLPEKAARAVIDSFPVIQFVSSTMAKTKDRALRKWIHNQHHQTMVNYADTHVLMESYHASVSDSVEKFASKINNETLMIAGQWDDITSVEQQLEVSAKLPKATLQVIPQVGHLIHYEACDQAATLIREFIS